MNYSILSILTLSLIISWCSAQPFQQDADMPHNNAIPGMTDQNMMNHWSINHGDVSSELQFIVEMIPHHQEAVDTSVIISQNSTNTGLRQLADTIIQTQTQEIWMMQSRLQQRYADSQQTSQYQNMMADLNTMTWSARDRSYLEGMIAHHQWAVDMAQWVLKLNPRPEIQQFAQTIITVQQAEIQMMELMLKQIP